MNGLLLNVQVMWIDFKKICRILERDVDFMDNDISSALFLDKYKMNKN